MHNTHTYTICFVAGVIHAKNESQHDLVAPKIYTNSFGFHPARKQITFQFLTFNSTFKKVESSKLFSSGLSFLYIFPQPVLHNITFLCTYHF